MQPFNLKCIKDMIYLIHHISLTCHRYTNVYNLTSHTGCGITNHTILTVNSIFGNIVIESLVSTL